MGDAGGSYPVPLPNPRKSGEEPKSVEWVVQLRNSRVAKGWDSLARNTFEDACRCYDFLRQDAMRRIRQRAYPLKGSNYLDCWCYEVGAGTRVYYKVYPAEKRAVIYFAGAGPHKSAPEP